MRTASSFTTPAPAHRARRMQAAGFTLVELMIGLMLGLMAVLVISQVMALAEGRKRTIAGGAEAQTNGALALFTLQRALAAAGYGLATGFKDKNGSVVAPLGCPIQGTFNHGGTTEAFSATLAPVVITDGADGAPDTLTVLEGRKSSFAVPIINSAQAAEFYTVKSSLGAAAGDVMVAVPLAWSSSVPCRLFSVTDDGLGSASDTGLWAARVPHREGVAGGNWNDNTSLAATTAAGLLNLGTLGYNVFSVSDGLALQATTRTATSASTTAELLPQIVNLQALYGKDSDGDGVVDLFDSVTPTTAEGWQAVRAIRIAVVARSTQYEKSAADESDAVTQSPPLWDVGSSIVVSGAVSCHDGSRCLELKVSHVPDWKHYRYKVYDTIVPLRNMIWNAAS